VASVLDDVDVRVKYLPTQDMTAAEGGFGSRGAVSLPSGRSHFRSPRDSFVGSGASASLSLPLVLSVVDRRAVDGASVASNRCDRRKIQVRHADRRRAVTEAILLVAAARLPGDARSWTRRPKARCVSEPSGTLGHEIAPTDLP